MYFIFTKEYLAIYSISFVFYSKKNSSDNAFLQSLENYVKLMDQYTDVGLNNYAKNLIPETCLLNNAMKKMRDIQTAISNTANIGTEPSFEDVLLQELTKWFNTKFFEWINVLPCKVCGRVDNTKEHKTYANKDGVRVEEFLCCGQKTRFLRYNDIKKLLLTRRGRCGEYANCFTFICSVLGYDSRLVYSTFDHMWTEVNLFDMNLFLH